MFQGKLGIVSVTVHMGAHNDQLNLGVIQNLLYIRGELYGRIVAFSFRIANPVFFSSKNTFDIDILLSLQVRQVIVDYAVTKPYKCNR